MGVEILANSFADIYQNYLNQGKNATDAYAAASQQTGGYSFYNLPSSTASQVNKAVSNTAAGAGRNLSGSYYDLMDILGIPAGLNKPYNTYPNGYSLGKEETAPSPQGYTPSPQPNMMSWEQALAQARAKLDPQYNSMRLKAEQSYSAQREQAPQLAAARWGMAGLKRGGGTAAQQADITQKEAAAIDELENQREAAIAELASNIQTNDYNSAMQAWQTAENLKAAKAQQEQQAAYQNALLAYNKEQEEKNNYWKALDYYLKQITEDREQSNWDKEFGLKSSGLEYNPEYQNAYIQKMLSEINQNNAQADRYSRMGYGGSDSGSSGKSSGENSYGNYEYYVNTINKWLSQGQSINDVTQAINALTPKNTGLTQSQINALKEYADGAYLPGYSEALKYFGLVK